MLYNCKTGEELGANGDCKSLVKSSSLFLALGFAAGWDRGMAVDHVLLR